MNNKQKKTVKNLFPKRCVEKKIIFNTLTQTKLKKKKKRARNRTNKKRRRFSIPGRCPNHRNRTRFKIRLGRSLAFSIRAQRSFFTFLYRRRPHYLLCPFQRLI